MKDVRAMPRRVEFALGMEHHGRGRLAAMKDVLNKLRRVVVAIDTGIGRDENAIF